MCIWSTSAAPMRPAHGTVSSQVATHLRTDRVCCVQGRSWLWTQDYWFAVRCVLICSQVRTDLQSGARFLAFFHLTVPSVFFHRSCDKTSTVCWAGGRTSQISRKRCDKCPHFGEKPARHGKRVEKILWQKVQSLLSRQQDITNVQK